jgi:D-beta-D-heptose 7-phosphate kinase/D-beta-D-heptose 1-phosphate adenosyltransferase
MTSKTHPSKLMGRETLVRQSVAWRREGRRIVFTNGCFDLLHAGHVRYLAAAKDEGDVLVVGLNSDRSVRRIKGAARPIVPQDQRAEILSALSAVDAVCLFDDPDPLALIRSIEPHVLAKGADWKAEDIIGGEWVRRAGGRVVRLPLVPHISTSLIIERILAGCRSVGDANGDIGSFQ